MGTPKKKKGSHCRENRDGRENRTKNGNTPFNPGKSEGRKGLGRGGEGGERSVSYGFVGKGPYSAQGKKTGGPASSGARKQRISDDQTGRKGGHRFSVTLETGALEGKGVSFQPAQLGKVAVFHSQ